MAVGNAFYERVPREGTGGAPARPGPAGQRHTGSEQVLGGLIPPGCGGRHPTVLGPEGPGCSRAAAAGPRRGDARLGAGDPA